MIKIKEPQPSQLIHFGTLGMHWGIRKEEAPSIQVKTKGIMVRGDGSIEVQKGASLQRLVRSNGSSLPMKDLTYASLTDYDNAKYIKTIGGKGFFGGGRDVVLKLTAEQPIKAPNIKDATKTVSDLFINDTKFRKTFTDANAETISSKDLTAIKKDPTGKVAIEWYKQVNTALTFDSEFDPTAPYIQKTIRETFQKKGFNALRDENDVAAGIAKAPIIIFSPEKSLKITSRETITDQLRKTSKEKLKQYGSLGRDWVNSQLYDN